MNTETSSHFFKGTPLSSNGAAHSTLVALTIAGSDPTSGAGIQADLKTFSAHGVYGLSVIAAITAQNTHGVHAVYPVSAKAIQEQCQLLIADIPIKIVKTGMIYESAAIEFIADFIIDNELLAVVDTPFAASNGKELMKKDAVKIFAEKLLPVAAIITPNIVEAQMLTGHKIVSKEDMEYAAMTLLERGAKAVLMKGGHLDGEYSPDVLVAENETLWLNAKRIGIGGFHGTGCMLSAAIAANLALGIELREAVSNAKNYVIEAIRNSISFGSGFRLLMNSAPIYIPH